MEDENGLELGLSLAWSQTSAKPKDIGENSDTRTEEGDRSSKLINDFKHFLDGGTGKVESAIGSQRSDSLRPSEKELWVTDDNKCAEEEEKEPESRNKRKIFFEEISNQRQERESHNSDLQERSKQSHISINTDDDSAAENEDVADSEVVGSVSRMVSHPSNSAKKYARGEATSDREVYSVFDTSAVDVNGQRGFTITHRKEFNPGKVPHNATFPSQSVSILNTPYSVSSKEHGDRPSVSVTPGNVSAAYGNSSVQIPVLDKDNSHILLSHHQLLPSSFAGRFQPTIDKINDGSLKVGKQSEVPQYNKDDSDKLPSELSAITPGIDSDLKFGGCGSYPNLPWVSTKGTGPNGKTISGVTYKFSPTQIKIVCACHGTHMSPEKFVRHASVAKTDPETGSAFATFPGHSNPAASAQS